MAAPATGQTELAVNVAGFLRGALGLGEAARLYVAALRAAGVPVSTTVVDVPLPDIGDGAVKKVAEFVESEEARQAPFNLVCVNAPELPASPASTAARRPPDAPPSIASPPPPSPSSSAAPPSPAAPPSAIAPPIPGLNPPEPRPPLFPI